MVTYSASMVASETDEMDAVFRALADPTRRRLLDALFAEDGRSAGQLCAEVPDMTRFGVMKHVGVLEQAGLVTSRREGRTKLHYLNPVPIGLVADRWISKYAAPFTRAMVGLRTGLESGA
jgi:DNA-binding transcriptional ArsR family regulator